MSLNLRTRIDRHIDFFTRTIIFAALIWWALGDVVPVVRDWTMNQSLWAVIVVVLVVEVIHRLSDLKTSADRVKVYANQSAAMNDLLSYVDTRKPASADFVLQSSASMGTLLDKLLERDVKIRILVQHPAANKHKREHIRNSIVDLLEDKLDGHPGTEVLCYRSPASLRGFRLGTDLVALGWYRYDKGTPHVLRGHSNALLVARVSSEAGRALATTFDGAFEALLHAPGTVDAAVALSELSEPVSDDQIRRRVLREAAQMMVGRILRRRRKKRQDSTGRQEGPNMTNHAEDDFLPDDDELTSPDEP